MEKHKTTPDLKSDFKQILQQQQKRKLKTTCITCNKWKPILGNSKQTSYICVHQYMGSAADSVAAFFTFKRQRFAMFEARQRGQKPNVTCPILNDLHFTNIHRYVARLIHSLPCNLLDNYHLELVLQQSRCLTIDRHNYCREVDSGTRYLRRRLVGRNDQEKLLGIIVFRTINRCVIAAFMIFCLSSI